MKKLVLLFFTTLNFISYSQSRKLDSLLVVVKKVQDTQQVNVLNEISQQYQDISDYDRAINYAIQAQQYAKEIDFKNGIANSYNNIAYTYYCTGRYDKALEFFSRNVKIEKENGDQNGLSSSYNGLGAIYMSQGDFITALDYFFNSLRIREKTGNKTKIYSSMNNIGLIYKYQNNYPKALEYFYKISKGWKKLGNKSGLGATLIQIGQVYQEIGDYDAALESYLNALKTITDLGDKKLISDCYICIGSIYTDFLTHPSYRTALTKGSYVEKALDYHLKALKIKKEIADENGIAGCLINIAVIYQNQGDSSQHNIIALEKYKKALDYYLDALKITEKIGDKRNTAICYFNISDIYLKQNKLEKALIYIDQGLLLFKQMEDKIGMGDAYLLLSEIYGRKQNYQQALKYYEVYSGIKGTIFNEKFSQQITEMNAKYESEKKEEEISLLKKDQKINELLIEKQQTNTKLLWIGLLATIIIGLFLYNRYRLKQQIILKTALAKEKEERIRLIIEATEKERTNIANDLHDSVGALMASIKLSFQTILIKNQQPNLQEALKYNSNLIDKAASEIRIVSHQMASKLLSYFGLDAAIKELIEPIVANFTITFEYNYPKRYKDEIELCVYRIVQEAINNLIKHSGASTLLIRITEFENNLILMIEDNGKGFNEQMVSLGIGFKNMKSRVANLHGDFELNHLNSGTQISVKIPLNFNV